MRISESIQQRMLAQRGKHQGACRITPEELAELCKEIAEDERVRPAMPQIGPPPSMADTGILHGLELRLTSGNSVPATSCRITADEFIALAREVREKTRSKMRGVASP